MLNRTLALLIVFGVALAMDSVAPVAYVATVQAEDPKQSPLATPKGSIAHQFELLKAGKVDDLRACFTTRQQERITAEAVKKGQKELSKITFDDLVAEITEGEFEGKKTAKIKMKNGRTLTTLILTGGKWLADTVWFN